MENNQSLWQVENLRLTAFYESQQTPDKNFFQKLFDQEADKVIYQKNPIIYQEEIQYGKGRLVLLQKSDRIDLFYLPLELATEDRINEEKSFFNTIEQFNTSIETFTPICNKLFDIAEKNFVRVAFGTALMQPASSKVEAYESISKFLPFEVDSEKHSELIYQINKPRESNLNKNILINCLAKFMVIKFGKDLLLISSQKEITKETVKEEFAGRLEIDINTKPEYKIPNILTSKNLFLEFIDIGKEISQKGN